MGDGADSESSQYLIRTSVDGKLQALEGIAQNVCRELDHTSSKEPNSTKAEHTTIITLFAARNEDAELGKASLAFKRLVQEAKVEAVQFRAMTIRILCKTIVDKLPSEIRNIIYRLLVPHGDQ